MSHLPECYKEGSTDSCICPELRACEQRVRREDDDYAYVAAQAEADGRRRGWSEALDAAREAVQLMKKPPPALGWYGAMLSAVAAIDALRDEPADPTGYRLPSAP